MTVLLVALLVITKTAPVLLFDCAWLTRGNAERESVRASRVRLILYMDSSFMDWLRTVARTGEWMKEACGSYCTCALPRLKVFSVTSIVVDHLTRVCVCWDGPCRCEGQQIPRRLRRFGMTKPVTTMGGQLTILAGVPPKELAPVFPPKLGVRVD